MCAIVGQLRYDNERVDRDLVKAMANSLRHRGPDGSGFHFDRRIGLGHRRLAILDPDGPGQPLSNEDGSLWVVGNHEIYNYRELRSELQQQGHTFRTNGDAEVILRLFEEVGIAAIHKLVGMFALAVWDAKRESLYLIRDPFGIKPLHYAHGDRGTLLFASELGALLCDKAVDRTMDPLALDGYLRTLTVPEPRCIYRAVKKVPAGHYLHVNGLGTELHGYFDLEVGGDRTLTEAQHQEQLREALEQTVSLSLCSDVEVGCFLSGGVDSSALVAIASQRHEKPIRTYSLGFDERTFDERPESRRVSQAFRSRHCEIRLTRNEAVDFTDRLVKHLDEPFADSSALPTFALSERAAEDVKTVLSGEGMDELFAGNAWHLPLEDQERPERELDPTGGPRSAIFDRSALGALYRDDLSEDIAKAHISEAKAKTPGRTIRGLGLIDRKLAYDLQTYLPSDLLTKMDRVPMISSLEVRVPYLNAPFARIAAGIGISAKIRGKTQKFLFKNSLRGLLPDPILDRPKKGFAIPVDTWLWQDGRFREMVLDVLCDARTRQRGLFNMAPIQKMLKEHDRLERFHGHSIWTLFMLEAWQRRHE